MCISAASPKHEKIDNVAALYWLHFRSRKGILIDLGIVQCSYPLRKDDASLRAIAHNTHEILARELVSIYKVKLPAR